MKSRSHIFALITACVFLFCGCSDYLSLSKASTPTLKRNMIPL